MRCRSNDPEGTDVNRRRLLGALALAIGGSLTGCSSLRIVLHSYPGAYDHDPELRTRLLTAFVRTVVPDATGDEPHLTRVFCDDFYPFHSYCGFFLSDLADTTRGLVGHEDFARLDLADRTVVIERGLRKGGSTGRLYTSAVFMAQFSFYAGIYDDARGCPLIEFRGANGGQRPNTMTRNEIANHLAPGMTRDGNPA